MHFESSLAHRGFSSSREAERLSALHPSERGGYVRQQLESYINHLAKDKAVSILYRYWTGPNGDLFVLPSRSEATNVKNQIDFNERNGLFYEGILTAASLAQQHPHQLILLYSPTGKKLFDDTPTDSIDSEMLDFLKKPYTDGQLYFLYFDGEELRNVAVSINSDNHPWLSEISPEFDEINEIAGEEQRIYHFLSRPIVVGDRDAFFSRRWKENYLVYLNKRERMFFLDDVLKDMKATLAGKKRVDPRLEEYLEGAGTTGSRSKLPFTAEMVEESYLAVLKNFMIANNMARIVLGGGCGGDGIDLAELSRDPAALLSSISNHFRYLRQDVMSKLSFVPDELKNKDSDGYPCKNCGGIIPWEKEGSDPKTWRATCPYCPALIESCVKV
ncbi:hypothetical protein HYW87_01565 [Candidatus Roizmanbacteria bacterium]|nr:hypothetical protein [Candidatus Roizmanbacteria bacterium]